MDLEPELLVDFYTKEVRSHLELAVPVWHSGLTRRQSDDIERIQRIILSIIGSETNLNYDQLCTLMDVEPLNLRRTQIAKNFALRTLKNPKYGHWFQKKEKHYNTRDKNDHYVEYNCLSLRYFKSPLPFLIRLLNNKQ